MTKEDAEKIADAICSEYYIRQSAIGWREALKGIIVSHLCPPAKLEWHWRKDLHCWSNASYWIVPTEAGCFAYYHGCVQPENQLGTDGTLAYAKDSCQAHSEARQ